MNTEFDFEFEVEGRAVHPGDLMYVNPLYYWKAGTRGKVEKFYGDSVLLRSPNGAVPTVPVTALSWSPFPEGIARDELERLGFKKPTRREVEIFIVARTGPPS